MTDVTKITEKSNILKYLKITNEASEYKSGVDDFSYEEKFCSLPNLKLHI